MFLNLEFETVHVWGFSKVDEFWMCEANPAGKDVDTHTIIGHAREFLPWIEQPADWLIEPTPRRRLTLALIQIMLA